MLAQTQLQTLDQAAAEVPILAQAAMAGQES
jgi:hypothetical protein